jgi:uncharacterized protein
MNRILDRSAAGISINVYVQPGAAASTLAGVHNNRLKMRLAAKAVDGAANKSLCEFVSNLFEVSKSCVTLVRGARSREKQVFIKGDPQILCERFDKMLQRQ